MSERQKKKKRLELCCFVLWRLLLQCGCIYAFANVGERCANRGSRQVTAAISRPLVFLLHFFFSFFGLGRTRAEDSYITNEEYFHPSCCASLHIISKDQLNVDMGTVALT